MSINSYVIASQVRDGTTGVVIAPAAGTVPTANGTGGATWLPVSGASSVALNDSNPPTGPNTASLVVGSSGPNLTVRRILGGANVSVGTTGSGEVQVSLPTALTGITGIAGTNAAFSGVATITGTGSAGVDLSQSGVVSVASAAATSSAPTILAWDSQPRSRWNTPTNSATALGTTGAPTAYVVIPASISNINEQFFNTSLGTGMTAFTSFMSARWIDVEYSGTFYVPGSATAVGVRNAYVFPFSGVLAAVPPTTPVAPYANLTLPLGTGTISATNPVPEYSMPFKARAQIYMNPGDLVRLVVVLSGTFATPPIISSVCFNASAMLTRTP